MALSMYNISSYSFELVKVIRNSTNGLKIVDFVKEADSESQFANRYDSIPLKILTSFIYLIEVIAAMIMFSFVYYERSGAAGSYRTVINQLLAYIYAIGVSYSIDFINKFRIVEISSLSISINLDPRQ
jgi:hypothetical protein